MPGRDAGCSPQIRVYRAAARQVHVTLSRGRYSWLPETTWVEEVESVGASWQCGKGFPTQLHRAVSHTGMET